MRIRKTLSSEHVLVDSEGTELTVRQLIERRNQAARRAQHRTSNFSIVLASYVASLIAVEGPGHSIPRFKGEVEARVQGDDVLRIAGRFRKGLGWREDRVKLRLSNVIYARVSGSVVELWLDVLGEGHALQRVALELFSPDAAGELVEWLPLATPWPEPLVPPLTASQDDEVAPGRLGRALLAGAGVAAVLAVALWWWGRAA